MSKQLIEEIFTDVPPESQAIVISMALFDRFCQGLTSAVMPDEHVEEFYAWLVSTNLFVIYPDQEDGWFRLHSFFREALLKRSEAEVADDEVKLIHQRATEWFDAQGMVQEAIAQALLSGDGKLAGKVVAHHLQHPDWQGDYFLRGLWLDALPAQVINQSSILLVEAAWRNYRANVDWSATLKRAEKAAKKEAMRLLGICFLGELVEGIMLRGDRGLRGEEGLGICFLGELVEGIMLRGDRGLTKQGSIITIVPDKKFRISVTNVGPDGRFTQYFSSEVTPELYEKEIAPARTFVYYEDVKPLLDKGLIKGGSLENAVVVRGEEVLSKEPMRYTNEFARHKALDVIGDLMLSGKRIMGHVICVKPGHNPNTQMASTMKREYMRMRTMVPRLLGICFLGELVEGIMLRGDRGLRGEEGLGICFLGELVEGIMLRGDRGLTPPESAAPR